MSQFRTATPGGGYSRFRVIAATVAARTGVHSSPDAIIAGVLNRQKRTTVTGLAFTVNRVSSLRNPWGIARFVPPEEPVAGEPLTIREAAEVLGLAPSTLHRLLNGGLIAGEQVTPGAPWRIVVTDALRALFASHAPDTDGDQKTGKKSGLLTAPPC